VSLRDPFASDPRHYDFTSIKVAKGTFTLKLSKHARHTKQRPPAVAAARQRLPLLAWALQREPRFLGVMCLLAPYRRDFTVIGVTKRIAQAAVRIK
jgi:hypothetical protein